MSFNSDPSVYFSPRLAAMSVYSGHASPEEGQAFTNWVRHASSEDVAGVIAGSLKDDVTGLWNGTGLREIYDYDAHVARISSPAKALFALMIDVEALGYANQIGYAETNQGLLAPLSQALEHNLRTADDIGRTGGDELTVIGVSHSSEVGIRPETARIHAAASLGHLLFDQRFLVYESNTVGLLVRAATIDASTAWEDVALRVDPKSGMVKGAYDYTKLPDGASLHRVYKNLKVSSHATGGAAYITSDNVGGYLVPFKTDTEMAHTLLESNFDASRVPGVIELTSAEVPAPYI